MDLFPCHPAAECLPALYLLSFAEILLRGTVLYSINVQREEGKKEKTERK